MKSSKTSSQLMLTATALALALALTGCHTTIEEPVGGIPAETLLALSPNGRNLVASWPTSSSARSNKLFTLSDGVVVGTRDVLLPRDTFTTAFGLRDNVLLVTTLKRKASDLVRVDIDNGDERTLIYRSPAMLRFPIELDPDHFVVLEARAPDDRYSHWQRLRHGEKSRFSDEGYRLAAPLEHVQGAVFQLEPRNPPSFRVFEGRLPSGLQALASPSSWAIKCANTNPFTCVRMSLDQTPIGQFYARLEIFNGKARCAVPGEWKDLRQMQFSRDGRTLVFHSTVRNADTPRAIYTINNRNKACTPVKVAIAPLPPTQRAERLRLLQQSL